MKKRLLFIFVALIFATTSFVFLHDRAQARPFTTINCSTPCTAEQEWSGSVHGANTEVGLEQFGLSCSPSTPCNMQRFLQVFSNSTSDYVQVGIDVNDGGLYCGTSGSPHNYLFYDYVQSNGVSSSVVCDQLSSADLSATYVLQLEVKKFSNGSVGIYDNILDAWSGGNNIHHQCNPCTLANGVVDATKFNVITLSEQFQGTFSAQQDNNDEWKYNQYDSTSDVFTYQSNVGVTPFPFASDPPWIKWETNPNGSTNNGGALCTITSVTNGC